MGKLWKLQIWSRILLFPNIIQLSLGQFLTDSDCQQFCSNGQVECNLGAMGQDYFRCNSAKTNSACDCGTNPPTSYIPPPPPGATYCETYCNLDCRKFGNFGQDLEPCGKAAFRCDCTANPPSEYPRGTSKCVIYCNKDCGGLGRMPSDEKSTCEKIGDVHFGRCACSANPPYQLPDNDCEKYCKVDCYTAYGLTRGDDQKNCDEINGSNKCDCDANPPKFNEGFAALDTVYQVLIIVGALILGLILIGVVICALICRRMTKRKNNAQTPMTNPTVPAPAAWSPSTQEYGASSAPPPQYIDQF